MAHTYDANDRARLDADTIGAGVSEATAGVAHAVRGAGDGARAGIAEMRHGAQHVVEAAKDKLHSAQHMVAERASETKHAVEDGYAGLKHTIVRNPMASVGIAAGVGVLVGLLLCRPRS